MQVTATIGRTSRLGAGIATAALMMTLAACGGGGGSGGSTSAAVPPASTPPITPRPSPAIHRQSIRRRPSTADHLRHCRAHVDRADPERGRHAAHKPRGLQGSLRAGARRAEPGTRHREPRDHQRDDRGALLRHVVFHVGVVHEFGRRERSDGGGFEDHHLTASRRLPPFLDPPPNSVRSICPRPPYVKHSARLKRANPPQGGDAKPPVRAASERRIAGLPANSLALPPARLEGVGERAQPAIPPHAPSPRGTPAEGNEHAWDGYERNDEPGAGSDPRCDPDDGFGRLRRRRGQRRDDRNAQHRSHRQLVRRRHDYATDDPDSRTEPGANDQRQPGHYPGRGWRVRLPALGERPGRRRPRLQRVRPASVADDQQRHRPTERHCARRVGRQLRRHRGDGVRRQGVGQPARLCDHRDGYGRHPAADASPASQHAAHDFRHTRDDRDGRAGLRFPGDRRPTQTARHCALASPTCRLGPHSTS